MFNKLPVFIFVGNLDLWAYNDITGWSTTELNHNLIEVECFEEVGISIFDSLKLSKSINVKLVGAVHYGEIPK